MRASDHEPMEWEAWKLLVASLQEENRIVVAALVEGQDAADVLRRAGHEDLALKMEADIIRVEKRMKDDAEWFAEKTGMTIEEVLEDED